LQAPLSRHTLTFDEDRIDPNLVTLNNPESYEAEQFKILRSNILYPVAGEPPRSILVTSTAPGEGKSLTASNLAIAMALDGRQVILVDTDLRRPTLHQKFGLDQKPGLTNVLVGHTPLEEALQKTHIPGLRMLACGPIPPNPAELLNSRAMRKMVEGLREQADIVIYDSPPCLATADAQVLSSEVDGVLYVIQLGQTRKSAVRHASEMLMQARARVIGLVFNKVDIESRRHDYYGYYSYYNYYNYYTSSQLTDGEPRRRRRSTSEFDALRPASGSALPKGAAATRTEDDDEEDDA